MHSQINLDTQNLEQGFIKVQKLYPNQDKDAKPYSGTFGILQIPKVGTQGNGSSWHLQNQFRKLKFNKGSLKVEKSCSHHDQDAKLKSTTCSILQSSNQDLKNKGILCTFKINVKGKNQKRNLSYFKNHMKIKIKTQHISQEPPVSY